MREHMKPHDKIDWIAVKTPEDLIRLVDPDVCVTFAHLGRSYPCVTIYDAAGESYLLDVLGLFQSKNQHEAAIRKMSLVPFVQRYILEAKIDVRGFVFVCDGWSADSTDRKTRRERAAGVPLANMTNRVPVVLYTAEMFDDNGAIQRAFAEREIRKTHKRPYNELLDLEVGKWAEEQLANKLGFGILTPK